MQYQKFENEQRVSSPVSESAAISTIPGVHAATDIPATLNAHGYYTVLREQLLDYQIYGAPVADHAAYTDTYPAVDLPLENAKLLAKQKANTQREQIEYYTPAVVNTPSHGNVPISMAPTSQANIAGLINEIRAGTFATLDNFLCEDGVFRTMTQADIEVIYAAGVAQKQLAFTSQKNVFALIDAATTVADLRGISL